jgi:hypothetical protein
MNELAVVRDQLPAAQPVTPMAMLQIAVEKGASVEQLERLMALQERYEANEAKKEFVVALAKFKENPPEIIKNIKVSFGNTKYSHAGLDQASDKIGAALAEVGISHTWEVLQGDKIKVSCILTHMRGHSERVSMEGGPDTSGSKSALQAIASAISFMQRYTLFMAVGIAPKNVDDDGRGGAGGPSALDPRSKAEFEGQINALAKPKEADALWQTIAAACSKCGDIATYDELKKALAVKVKALKTEPAQI